MRRSPEPRLRILVVEDDRGRENRIRAMLPAEVLAVVVNSGGKALGLLERDRGSVYAGILLDHDLQGAATQTGGLAA